MISAVMGDVPAGCRPKFLSISRSSLSFFLYLAESKAMASGARVFVGGMIFRLSVDDRKDMSNILECGMNKDILSYKIDLEFSTM